MNVKWGWYFAGFSGLAAAAVCLLSLYLACSSSVRGYAEKAAVRGEKQNVNVRRREGGREGGREGSILLPIHLSQQT
jgi:hypothetical protein